MTISTAAASCGLVLFPLAMIYAGLMDLVTLKIRNSLVIGIGCAWLLLAPLSGFTMAELGASAAVGGAVLVVTFIFFAAGWIGGGDAKLAAVTALWFQPHEALVFFAYASVLGGILTLVIMQLRTGVIPMFFYRVPWIAQLHDSRTGVPYGAAMAPAALLVFPDTAWVMHALT
jgi:prepilin peptidase CpaA